MAEAQQALTPQRLVDALSLTCRPRESRDALVLAVQACVLRALGARGVSIEATPAADATEGGKGGSSLLSAYHALPNKSTYPEQRYRLPSSSAPTLLLLLLLKPFTLDIPAASPQSYEALDSETEPALVLFGRALQQEEGKDKDTIHRLALRVAEFVSPVSDDADEEADGDGRVVVSIKGAGGGLAWRCRLGALGDRLIAHLLAKLLPPAFFPHQLPTLLNALPPPPPPGPSLGGGGPGGGGGSGSYNSPFPLLLAFLPAPHSVLALASTCRDCRPLDQDGAAWAALLDRDFSAWRSSSSSSSSSSPSTTTTTAGAAEGSALATYRRLYQEKQRKEGGLGGRRGGLYRPFNRRPLPMTPGGVLLPPYFDRDPEYFEGGSGLGWPRRPLRYFPFFGAPVPGPAQPPFGGGWGDWAWA